MLAVGLAEAGCEVAATDASPAMVACTCTLAAERGVAVDADVCAWEDLAGRGWQDRFDAVFCVGNSLAHAPGRAARLTALRAMAGVVRPGGSLVLTSRNWELVRSRPPGIEVAESLTERGGRRGLLIYAWHAAAGWDERHDVDIAVALLATGTDAVATHAARLAYWPFTHEQLARDLEAAGLAGDASTYEPDLERYVVSARLGERQRS
jgi:SAM-dependent methyltransferase